MALDGLTPPRDVSSYGDPRKHGARCDICPLAGSVYVPYEKPRSGKLRLVLVGEGPGRKEEILRTPFCLVPETPVLMADLSWKSLGEVRVGDRIMTVQEEPDAEHTGASGYGMRRWQIATVTGRIAREAETIRVSMASGRELVGTPDHRVLAKHGTVRRWLKMSQLHAHETHERGRKKIRRGSRSSSITDIGAPWGPATSWEAGWLAGFFDGEGHVLGSKRQAHHAKKTAGAVGFSQNVGPTADYAVNAILRSGFRLRAHEESRSYTGKTIKRAHVAGGFLESMRFLGTIRPARLIEDFQRVVGHVRMRGTGADRVIKKSPAGKRLVIDIETTAGTFIANGYVAHNCGMTGTLLNDELDEIGVPRSECYATNAALCASDNDQDNARAAECCAPRLLKELSALPKDVPILALGKAATRSILGVKSVLLARGFVWTSRVWDVKGAEANVRKIKKSKGKDRDKKLVEAELRLQTVTQRTLLADRTVLPTLHPTFAFIHNEAWSPIFRIDLDRAARVVRGKLDTSRLVDRIVRTKTVAGLAKSGRYVVTDNKNEIREAAKWLGPTVACDIETESTQPLSPLTVRILCVQVSDGERTFVIGPWDPRLHADVLTGILRGRKVVFHNGYNFDQPALERDGVVLDPNDIEDTLVAHHTFASHYPQRLDHVVSTFLDASPWKIRFGRRGAEEKGLPPQHMDPEELYHYGAVDAVLTALAWRVMQADLKDELAVYAHDKLLGAQGKGLQVDGFRVDTKRKEELSKGLKARAGALKGRMRKIIRRPNFAPSKLGDVRRALFGTLKAPMLNPTSSGLASTSNATLEVLRTGGAGTARRGPADTKKTNGPIDNETRDTRVARFSEALLNWRVAVKIKGTYVDAVSVHADGRAHYNWRPYGTVSGRYSCRLQSCPRWSKEIQDRAREMYTASEGSSLVYFDLSQAEARFAANLSGDPNFIKTCEGDVHTGNAKILFPAAREVLERDAKGKHCPQHGDEGKGGACNCGKPFRDIAKNAGFAVSYLADASTVFAYLRAHGFPVELDAVEGMLDSLKAAYKRYYEFVYENVAYVKKHGHLRTAITGRVRWFGFNPKPTEIANFPIQSGIADVMNTRLLALQRRMRKELPRVRLVAQVHDAAIFDVADKDVETVRSMIVETWKEPARLPVSIVCRAERSFFLPAEIKVGKRWSDFG